MTPGLDRGLHDVSHHLHARPALGQHRRLDWRGLERDPKTVRSIEVFSSNFICNVTLGISRLY